MSNRGTSKTKKNKGREWIDYSVGIYGFGPEEVEETD